MHIPLRRGQVLVPRQLLDRPYGCSSHGQMWAERVFQGVHALMVELGSTCRPSHPILDHLLREGSTVRFHQHPRPTQVPMPSQGVCESDGQWHIAETPAVRGALAPTSRGNLLQYDPWDAFRANLGKYRTVEQPYLAVLELRRQLAEMKRTGVEPTQYLGESPEGPRLTPSTPADLLVREWCGRYGLLGLVPVLASRIELPRRIRREKIAVRIDWSQHFRHGGRWDTHTGSTGQVVLEEADIQEAEDKARHEVEAEPPTTTWITWISGAQHERPTDELRAYFPRLSAKPCSFIPPQPLTQEFWESYGEPVWEFAECCHFFGQAVDALGHWPGQEVPEDRRPTAERAFAFMRALALAAAPLFTFDATNSTAREERVSAGLLASYALMFLLDCEAGRRCRRCENCSR